MDKPIKCIAFQALQMCLGLKKNFCLKDGFFHFRYLIFNYVFFLLRTDRLIQRIVNGYRGLYIGMRTKRISFLFMDMPVAIMLRRPYWCVMLSFKMDNTICSWLTMEQWAEHLVIFHSYKTSDMSAIVWHRIWETSWMLACKRTPSLVSVIRWGHTYVVY